MPGIIVGCSLFIKSRIAFWFIGIRSVSAVIRLIRGVIDAEIRPKGRIVSCEEIMLKSVEVTLSALLTVLLVFVL